MVDIVHVYQKKRREFGRQCVFSDRHAVLNFDLDPNPEDLANHIERTPLHAAVECRKEFSEHEVNTDRKEYASRGINHLEGGWPKDVDPNEADQVARFRKKVEKDENFQHTVVELGESMLHCIRQNEAVDIYGQYFDDSNDSVAQAPDAKTTNVFRDPNEIKRSISYIGWHPDGPSQFAVAYSIMEFQKMPAGMSLDSYIWDSSNPNAPAFTLSPSSPLMSIEFNPKDVHTLLGGCYNGQVVLFDTRKGSRPVESSPIENSHHDPVYRALFLQSKAGTDAFSASTDGNVMWWDVRNLSAPVETVVLNYDNKEYGGTTLEFEPTIPTKFMVGTEQGGVLMGNRKGKTPADKIAGLYQAHHGPVYSLQRNPFNPKFFMSVGDWSMRIWCEDIKESAVMWTKFHMSPLTCGAWSPTRPAVNFTARADGTLDIWDLLFKTSAPTLSVQVGDAPITAMSVAGSGRHVACGLKDGSVTLLELNDPLSVPIKEEKASMAAMFERETSREKIIVSRARELALKVRVASAKPRPQSSKRPASGKRPESAKEGEAAPAADEEGEENPIVAAEKSFWEAVNSQKGK